jgi:hypothetical protein
MDPPESKKIVTTVNACPYSRRTNPPAAKTITPGGKK